MPNQSGSDFEKMWRDAQSPGKSPVRQILHSRDLRKLIPYLAVSVLFINILALALPLTLLQVFNRIIPNQAYETLVLLTIGVIVAGLLEKGLRVMNNMVTAWLGARYEHGASLASLNRLLSVPLRRFRRDEPSTYLQKMISATRVANFYSGKALLVLFDMPFILLFLAVIWLLGGWLVVVPAVLLVMFLLVIFGFTRWIRDGVHARQALDDRRFSFLYEVISGILPVKAQALETGMSRRYERLQGNTATLDEQLTRGNAMANSLGVVFSQVMAASVIFGGAWLVLSGNMSPGALAACMMLSIRAMSPLRRGLGVWLGYQAFVEANGRLNEMMALPSREDGMDTELPPVKQGIRLERITLRKNPDQLVFEDLTLDIPAGRVVAIQGESGCGKSALLDLIAGLAEPDSGKVLLDDRPLTDYSSAVIHRQIALLPQSPTLLAGTIMNNVTMFNPQLESKALALSRRLGLDLLVAGMPMGYETRLGEGVAEVLPEGVCQLIAVVRTLVHPVSVILFDEANLSLDFDGDWRLRTYLQELKGKVTVVLVTHRPSWLAIADYSYVLRDRQIKPGAFAGAEMQVMDDRMLPMARPEELNDVRLLVRQQFMEETDFSLVLPQMLRALEWKASTAELLEAMPHRSSRLDVSGFCSVMSALGYRPRRFRGNLDTLDTRLIPCLFVPDEAPAMVVSESNAQGRLKLIRAGDENAEWQEPVQLPGEVIVFEPDPVDEMIPDPAEQGPFMRNMLWQFRKHIAVMLGLTVLVTVLGLAPAVYIRIVYDRVLPTGDIRMGGALLIGVLLAILMELAMLVLRGRVLAYMGGRGEYLLGNSIVGRILSLPLNALENASVYRQVGRIRYLQGLREQFVNPIASMAMAVPAAVILVAVLAMINPTVLLVVLVNVVLMVALFMFVCTFLMRVTGQASRFSAIRWEFLNETLNKMRVLHVMGMGRKWLHRFKGISGKSVMANYRDARMNAIVYGIVDILGRMTGIAALVISAVLVMQGHLSGGLLMMTMILVWRLLTPMMAIFSGAIAWMRVRSGVSQVNQLMRLRGERTIRRRNGIQFHVEGDLTFRRVSFRYANDKDPVLLGLNFTVPARQFLVITGSSGAGKSTLLKLILQLYTPQAGAIQMGGIDIRQVLPADLRGHVSYMPQHLQIFYGTIEQNLRLVYPKAADAELAWAIRMSGLEDDLALLPEGLDTRINNAAADMLPNGFRQRLSLARTMLRPASLVLMDEPGNGMNSAGEISLMHCLNYLRGRATVIMVSHRPTHMSMADNVILLQGGVMAANAQFETQKEKFLAGLV